MTRPELIALLEAVRADLVRDSGKTTELSRACLFAIWHLKGEPSFVERNDQRRTEQEVLSMIEHLCKRGYVITPASDGIIVTTEGITTSLTVDQLRTVAQRSGWQG